MLHNLTVYYTIQVAHSLHEMSYISAEDPAMLTDNPTEAAGFGNAFDATLAARPHLETRALNEPPQADEELFRIHALVW